MEQAETIEVMGVTLTRSSDGAAWWRGRVGTSDLMVFAPEHCAHVYHPSPVPDNARWSALMTSAHSGATVQLQHTGPTLADAINALRGALNAVTETRATIGRDLAALLYEDHLQALDALRREMARACEICGRAAQQMGTEARCARHDSEKETGR